MQINVSQLLQEPIGSIRDYRIDEAADIVHEGEQQQIYGDCHLTRTRQGVLTRCSLDTTVEQACNRCLEHYDQPIHVEFEEEFIQTVDVTTGFSLPGPEDPGAFTIDTRHILDITEAVRQYALMAIPFKALCRDNCAGLCPTCGKNLNEGPCQCPADGTDPRWSALEQLK